jgi:hypothetical protein
LKLEYRAPSLVTILGNSNESGSVHFWENAELFPQGILRCFWISGVREGESRGNHAHWEESQVLVAVNGSVEVRVSGLDGSAHTFSLQSAGSGLLVPPLNWIQILFSSDAVLLGLSDLAYSESDFIRDKDHFERLQKGNS